MRLLCLRRLYVFSGGVDSSVVASLVYRVYPSNSFAVIGVSPSLPIIQLEKAREIASSIGIPLTEVPTFEGLDKEYVKNVGNSCFICKKNLYESLRSIADFTSSSSSFSSSYSPPSSVSSSLISTPQSIYLYNGKCKPFVSYF